jgi:hypothetical protein
MSPNISSVRTDGRAGVAARPGLLALALLVLAGSAAAVVPSETRKLNREITVVEKVMDDMLLDSKNLLVFSTDHNAHGLYLDEYGVVFSFNASLVDRPENMNNYSFGGYRIEDKGDKIVVYKDKAMETNRARAGSADSAEGKARRAEDTARLAGLYAAGKREIADILLDYGPTLTSLRDDQWVAVGAFLKGSDFFQDRHISRLVVKARMSDLRAMAAGRITRDVAATKILEEEY